MHTYRAKNAHRSMPIYGTKFATTLLVMSIHWVLVLVTTLILTSIGIAHAQEATSLRVVSVDTNHPPQAEILVDYTLANGQPVSEDPHFVVRVNNQPITITAQRRSRVPINVAIVTDLSARMSDQGAPYTTRFDNMAPLVKDLVSQLQAGSNYASLITFSDSVDLTHLLNNDLQAIANTLNRGNPDLVFEPQPLDAATPESNYPLYEAIRNGIVQLVSGEIRPRALVIFAAGGLDPEQISRLSTEVDLARQDRTPIQVLVFGFGSDAANSFKTFPAGTQSLQDLADALNGTFINLGNELLSVQTRQQIDQQFDAIVRRGDQWLLTFNAGSAPAGTVALEVEANGSSSTFTFENPTVPPAFTITTSSVSWQDQVTLTIVPQVEQAPISRVQYLLDNYVIGESSDRSASFAYQFSAADRNFHAQFPPGEHTLIAAATDMREMQSRSSSLTITILPPTGPTLLVGILLQYWWTLLLGVLVIVGGVSTKKVLGKRTTSAGKVITDSLNPNSSATLGEEATKRYDSSPSSSPSSILDDDTRTRSLDETEVVIGLDEEKTARYSAGDTNNVQWSLIIVEGGDATTFDLSKKRHYDVGRPAKGHQPDIPVNNPLVSRNHAKLERLRDNLELVALETENGTFVGEEKRRLETDERVELHSGDVFWLSPRVKLRVESNLTDE